MERITDERLAFAIASSGSALDPEELDAVFEELCRLRERCADFRALIVAESLTWGNQGNDDFDSGGAQALAILLENIDKIYGVKA